MLDKQSTAGFTSRPVSWTEQLTNLRPSLRAHAIRLTGDPNRAEDLVQDTIERALRFRHRFRNGTNLKGWTHRILLNLFIGELRKHERERRALEKIRTDPLTCAQDDPVRSLPLTTSTRQALATLPPHYREALRCVDVHGMSYREAAERLQVPVGTVMSRLHRARRMLGTRLRDEHTQRVVEIVAA